MCRVKKLVFFYIVLQCALSCSQKISDTKVNEPIKKDIFLIDDAGFENGVVGPITQKNSVWEVQRIGSSTFDFVITRMEDSNAFAGKRYCSLLLPENADPSKFDHVTIGQRKKLQPYVIYEARINVKWNNPGNGNETAIVSFWAQHQPDKTFAGKDVWLKNSDWTIISFRFMAVKSDMPVFIYFSLLPHQKPKATEILIDEFHCEKIEDLPIPDSNSKEIIKDGDFENQNIGSIVSLPWNLIYSNNNMNVSVSGDTQNKQITMNMPANTDNYTAIKLMQSVSLQKGVLYHVKASLKWNNFSENQTQGIVNLGIYHPESNTWWGPIDYILKNGEWNIATFTHGAPFDGQFQLYVQVFGWGNFGKPMNVTFDNFSLKSSK